MKIGVAIFFSILFPIGVLNVCTIDNIPISKILFISVFIYLFIYLIFLNSDCSYSTTCADLFF